MSYRDVYSRARDEAYVNGTIDTTDREGMAEFREAFDGLMRDDDGNRLDHFPSAGEIDSRDWGLYIEFLDEYDLWDEFRDDWERYEKAA